MSDKVQLLWSRSAVSIHPTKQSSDNIPGYLSVVKTNSGEILISWVPEHLIKLSKQDFDSYVKVDLDDSGAIQSNQSVYVKQPPSIGYAARSTHAFSIALSQIYTLQIREPSLGWWYGSVLIYTRSQEALPALFFHDDESESDRRRRRQMTNIESAEWGGTIFLKFLETQAKVLPSRYEKGLYLVNPDPSDKVAFMDINKGNNSPYQDDEVPKPVAPGAASQPKAGWNEVKWGLFQRLAKVTRFSRMAGQKVFDRTPAPVRTMLNIPEVEQLGQDFDSARVFLAEWALGIAQEQEEMQRQKVDVMWSDTNDLDEEEFSLVSTRSTAERRNPVTESEWESFFNPEDGRLAVTSSEVKDRIFHGGLEPPVRPEAWLFLLGVYPWDSSKIERQSIIAAKQSEYYRLKRKWWEDIDMQNNDDFWKDQKSRIEKDVLRTDRQLPIFATSDIPHPDPESRFAVSGANPHLEQLRDILTTYNEYNVNLGYVQGMTDLLSPLYVVLQDDSLAFTAFCAFMERMERNFMRTQEGMRDQLQTLGHLTNFLLPRLHAHLTKADSSHFFFFFRMILVWFKREFEWDDVMRLWEVLWTDYYSSQFHLFVAVAILDLNKDIIMGRLHHFDEILKYINDLGLSMDLDIVLTRAEQLFNRFKTAVSMVDHQKVKNPNDAKIPEITPDLRRLLSKKIVVQKESERPPGAGGG